jgi:hypothetical protein
VRVRTVQVELRFLKSALQWAYGSTDEQVPLVTKSVFVDFAIPQETDPRRPVMKPDTAEALYAVAPSVHPLLPLLILMVGSTGRRLGSVLGLT